MSYDFTEEPRSKTFGREYSYAIRARLVIEGKNLANRRDELVEALRQPLLWPGIEIREEAARFSAAIMVRYVYYGLPPEVSEKGMDFVVRCGASEVEVIERMLYMLKGGLEPSDRPFDLRTFGGWEGLRYRPWADDEHRFQSVEPETLFRLTG